MITFQEQTLAEVRDEMEPLLVRHWEEIALHRDRIKLDIDWPTYHKLDAARMLNITTARDDGALIGYVCYVLVRNPHYKSQYVADCDIFWLDPDRRRGTLGMKLIRESERFVIARGVNQIVTRTKLHHDLGPLLERLGYEPIERVYTKLVG